MEQPSRLLRRKIMKGLQVEKVFSGLESASSLGNLLL